MMKSTSAVLALAAVLLPGMFYYAWLLNIFTLTNLDLGSSI